MTGDQLALFADGGCFVCGSMDDLHTHHIDWNHANNAVDNRVRLCGRCHAIIHRSVGYVSRDELLGIREAVERRRKSLG